ncbi:MAG: CBS domain-containing protein [Bacteroidota bacterium]
MIAKQLITDSVTPVKPSDTGAFAIVQMEDCRLSHIPVVNDLEFLGLISDRDILSLQDPENEVGSGLLPLSQVNVEENQHIYEVIKLFAAMKLTVLPVVSSKNHYMGAITLPSLVSHLADLAAIQNPGGIIVLEINNKDYSVMEIARIVESNDAKILSLYMTSFPESTKLEVTIKVNRMEIGAILQTFDRYNYVIKATWSQEDAYSEGLQDRFDALMNYLSI